MNALPRSLRSGLQQKHLPALDGMRAIAAYTVVFYHFGWEIIPGGMGVLAFFVLSGFLITWLLLEEQERYGSISIRKFYARRTLRIFPAFYAYWLLAVIHVAYKHRHGLASVRAFWVQAACSFFYVNNYYQGIFGDPDTGLSHTWSLGVEEQFYLIWPVSFLLLQRLRPERTVRVLAWIIGILWVYRWALVFAGMNQGYIYEAFDTRADHLLIGCLLAFALRYGAFSGLWKILCGKILYSLIMAAALAGSALLQYRYGTDYRDAAGFVLDPLLVALLIPQLIAAPAWRFLDWGPVRYLGRISYSVYLWQQLAPGVYFEKLMPSAGHAAAAAVNAILVTAIASASFYLIERPFIRLKGRFKRPLR